MSNETPPSFKGLVLRPSLQTLLIAGLATATLAFGVATVTGETRLSETVALNQWLARDIASQFTGTATHILGRAQKFGALVRSESGTFDPLAQREFDAHPSLKGVWILDASATGPLQPLAKLERDGFTVAEAQIEGVRRLTDAAIREGSATRGILPGLNAVAVKIGDMPRTVLIFSDESLFARASGGPWGDKWMLLAPSADKTESVLVEATSELKEGTEFPSFEEISRLVLGQSPTQERSEFTSEIASASGARFQVSGVRAGAFNVTAVAITPIEASVVATNVGLFMRLAMGIAVALSLLVMAVQLVRFNRAAAGARTQAIRVEEIP